MLRSAAVKAVRQCTSVHILKRSAHKKASIQVKLNEFVEGVGIKDEVVTVRPGLMRNVLYPSGKATYIEKNLGSRNRQLADQQELEAEEQELHLSMKAEKRRERTNELLNVLEDVKVVEFERALVPNSSNTFGSVTADDLVNKLKEEFALDVDKQTIEFQSEGGRIKSVGEHLVTIQLGQQSATIKVIVKAA
ncbi:uncharacterized protein BYT42DRAFT_555833 [Radiomyces spectabilis]|uniref:uncharacterized protein n=1 Tax=Radiomyces spectabilis TaxID=64574 RepID=UPI002220873A|nr:uncharacterized protein BYT42DRAFT_555833 [Radiomyces spectabilis]KAI8391159.1 hypothetical protein BYT42DRAFT_555833 [Radiomyces spectabilis]